MREFQQRRRVRDLIYSRFALGALFVLAVIFARGTWGIYSKYSDARLERAHADEELSDLKARKSTLEREVASLHTDYGLEEKLREKFQVARPGEKMVVIVQDPSGAGDGTGTGESFFQKIFDFFTRD
jgi:cell division protein FtsB